MAMQESTLQTVQHWFDSKEIVLQCPACGSNDWKAGEIVAAPTIKNQQAYFDEHTVPMVQIICGNCGHIMFFSAHIMGITLQEQE